MTPSFTWPIHFIYLAAQRISLLKPALIWRQRDSRLFTSSMSRRRCLNGKIKAHVSWNEGSAGIDEPKMARPIPCLTHQVNW